MLIIDANIVLRYLLSDHEELSAKAEEIIDKNNIHLPIEVLCEVVYVLEKVYSVGRSDISDKLTSFINDLDIALPSRETVLAGLQYYGSENLDFVDCILVGYAQVENVEVHTFDKKVNRLLNKIAGKHSIDES